LYSVYCIVLPFWQNKFIYYFLLCSYCYQLDCWS